MFRLALAFAQASAGGVFWFDDMLDVVESECQDMHVLIVHACLCACTFQKHQKRSD